MTLATKTTAVAALAAVGVEVALPSWAAPAAFALIVGFVQWLATRQIAGFERELLAVRERSHNHANLLSNHSARIDNLERRSR